METGGARASESKETKRVFIAFPIPQEVQQHLMQVQHRLEETAPRPAFRWINPYNTHITMHFLGDVHTEAIPHIIDCIREAVSSPEASRNPEAPGPPETGSDKSSTQPHTAIRCRLGGLGYFPPRKTPRVVWLGLNEMQTRMSPDLHAKGRALYTDLDQRLRQAAFESSSSRYSPHITLGYRLRSADAKTVHAAARAWQQSFQPQGLIFSLTSVVLYESFVGNNGREHQPLHIEELPGGPHT